MFYEFIISKSTRSVPTIFKSIKKTMNIIENAFPDAAGGNFWCFLVFLFKIPYVLAYMTFLEILKILQNDRAYMTSYMLGQHCTSRVRSKGPNPVQGFDSGFAKVPWEQFESQELEVGILDLGRSPRARSATRCVSGGPGGEAPGFFFVFWIIIHTKLL